MTEQSHAAAVQPSPSVGASAGALLRQAREARNMPIEALAAAIKVTPAKLAMLERDDHSGLLDATFVRGLAQTVARYLRIDPEPVLARLPPLPGRGLEQATQGLNKPFREHAVRREGSGGSGPAGPVVWMALLLVCAAAVVYFVPSGTWSFIKRAAGGDIAATGAAVENKLGGIIGSDVPASANGTVVTELPSVTVDATSSTQSNPSSSSSTAASVAATGGTTTVRQAGASDLAVAPSATTAANTTVTPAAAVATGTSGANEVELKATSDSWVGVTDATGKRLLQRLLLAGETVAVDGPAPLKLTIGNAKGTSLKFRGQPVAVAQGRDNVARMELK
jgi:cytoskeleton protein RodZ